MFFLCRLSEFIPAGGKLEVGIPMRKSAATDRGPLATKLSDLEPKYEQSGHSSCHWTPTNEFREYSIGIGLPSTSPRKAVPYYLVRMRTHGTKLASSGVGVLTTGNIAWGIHPGAPDNIVLYIC